ncbi:RNA-directed DNA polymerase from mobile element jockey, partial [Harpegnathos saltator]
ITIKQNNRKLNIAAAYCPPRHNIKKDQFEKILLKLGSRFIIGGDFNSKHKEWGSRLTTSKGRELFKAINACKCDYISSGKPTYWPTDVEKTPDLLDFYITKGISNNYLKVGNIEDLSSDHVPVLMTISSMVIRREKKYTLTNKHTDWEKFRE